MTKAEVILWSRLRRKQFGYRFLRQYSIGKFILDFYCPKLLLCIEVDGGGHYDSEDKIECDKRREKVLEKLGISTLRVTNTDVYKNMDGVILAIEDRIEKLSS